MNRREGIIVSQEQECDGAPGYMQRISVEISVFTPPGVPMAQILETLETAYTQAKVRAVREL